MPSDDVPAEVNARLHPLSLVFSIGSAAWKLLLPGIIVLVAARGQNYEIWLMVLFVPTVLAAFAKYVSFRYRLGRDELVIREGILTRNERHIPYARIQNIDLVQNPLHRLFRVAQIRIETAGGDEPEANIQVLSLSAVEQMRARVFRERRAARAAGGPEAAEEAPGRAPAHTILRLGAGDLVTYGVISNRGLAVVLAVWGLAWQASWQGWAPDWLERWTDWEQLAKLPQSWNDTKIEQALPAGGASTWLLAVGALLVLLILLRVISIVWTFVKLYGFTLARSGEDLRTSYGLFTRRQATIPRNRIQSLTVRQSLTHRMFGRHEIRVETAGAKHESEEGVSSQLVAPLVRSAELPAVLTEIQPELELERVDWQRIDPRAWRRIVRKLCAVLLLAGAAGHLTLGLQAWFVVALLLPPALWLAWLRFRRMAYALTASCVFYRSGWWVRRLTVSRFAKIQVVDMRQNPFDRRLDMAAVVVDTAGAGSAGHRLWIPYLHLNTARAVFGRLSLEAAGTEFRW